MHRLRAAPGQQGRHLQLGMRRASVRTESTPNPESLMFYSDGHDVLGKGTKTLRFNSKYDTSGSPLASAIFRVRGVSEVMLASQHVTVTKDTKVEWEMIRPNIQLVISQFYAAGLRVVDPSVVEKDETAKPAFAEGSLEERIVELIEERVKPQVQQDGGDIEFNHFDAESGVVYLEMHGACSGCPKSAVTLQMGIKGLLKHYIPEVTDVISV